ncbi:MAG: AAA family ATPase [Candidatus Aenigmatarchaeota archaeon]
MVENRTTDEKMAFAYSHGGPVFDKNTKDGLNERGRNIIKSIISAISVEPGRIFVSESVCPGDKSQIKILIERGFFHGLEKMIDFEEYPVAKNVKFPKNYLFNRGAQRADGYFGLIFSDSDVVYNPGFVGRVLHTLHSVNFCQPEKLVYLNSDGSDPQKSYFFKERMPGMVNAVNRDKFLEIGGFSQAISGVNWEDVEFQTRLQLLREKKIHMSGEIIYHLFHARNQAKRLAENLPTMYLENLNFHIWLFFHFLKYHSGTYDKKNFDRYMKVIKESLEKNKTMVGPYTNETGTIAKILGFDPSKRYKGYIFGDMEPYSELESKEVQVAALKTAAKFWGIPEEEVLRINKQQHRRGYTIIFEDYLKDLKKRMPFESKDTISHSKEFFIYIEEILNEIEKMSPEERKRNAEFIVHSLRTVDDGFLFLENKITTLIEESERTPKLIVLTGFPTTGKTSIALFIERYLGFAMLSADEIAKGIFGHGHPFGEGENPRKIFETVFRRRDRFLNQRRDVVIDSGATTDDQRKSFFSTPVKTVNYLIWIQAKSEILEKRLKDRPWVTQGLDELVKEQRWRDPREKTDYELLIYENNDERDMRHIKEDLTRRFSRSINRDNIIDLRIPIK